MKPSQQLAKYLREPRVKRLYEKVKAEYDKRGPIAHGWDHIYRDIINSIWIGEAEGADMNIVIPAVILHDIGFLYNSHPKFHHMVGAKKCLEWLGDWDSEKKEMIRRCILRHKGKKRDFNYEPETIEEKVVYDADLLEKTGAISIFQGVRSMVEFAEGPLPKFRTLYNIAKKLEELSASEQLKFYTKKGKELAKRRRNIRKGVFSQAVEELEKYEK